MCSRIATSIFLVPVLFFTIAAMHAVAAGAENGWVFSTRADLGQAVFFDRNFSLKRNQACASCHDPAHGFVDARDNGVSGAASVGDDTVSLGDRNAPSLSYVALTPDFSRDQQGVYRGGFFHDGRAPTLADQAGQPFLNPIEMALPNAAAVMSRAMEQPHYRSALRQLFGEEVLDCVDCVYRAIAECLAAFERGDLFSPFDSRYDRYLKGRYKMTKLEEQGRILFFSPLTNCSSCHLLNVSTLEEREAFTNFEYRNIGIPRNLLLREKNGVAAEYQDPGLLQNNAVSNEKLRGKFKVPSLRNVAVTGPYMHNGVFRKLTTAIGFYNQYTVNNATSQMNPETGKPWGAPEVPETIDRELLHQGQPLDEARVLALAAFLKTLTDGRYEMLLNSD